MKNLLTICAAAAAFTAATNTAFAEDPYIVSDGTTGISTGYKLKPTTRLEIDFQLTDSEQTNQARLFGADYNNAEMKMSCCVYISNQYLVYGVGNGAKWNALWMKDSSNNYLLHDISRHTAVLDFNNKLHHYMTEDVDTATYKDNLAYTEEATQPIALFASKNASDFQNPAKLRIYGVKIYEDGDIVHDFEPCKMDGLAGFRDRRTGKFIANGKAHAAFSAGGDYVTYENPYVATPANNSACYIDTEYKATSNTCFMLDCALRTGVTGSTYSSLFCGAGSTYFHGFINPSSGFGVETSGATAGILGLDNVNVLDIRRTFVLDAYNRVGCVMTAGVTNGTKTTAQSTEHGTANWASVKIGAKFNGESNYSSLKVYGCKIYESGTLVRDFKPCYKNGIAGLTDTITGLFVSYPSDKARTTANSLSVGGNINIEADPYIEGAGLAGQYFATNYKAKKTTRVEIDFAQTVINDTTKSHYIFGSRGESSGLSFFAFAFTSGGYGYSCADGSANWGNLKVYTQTTARQTMILDAKNDVFAWCNEYGVTNNSWSVTTAHTKDASKGFVIFGTREGDNVPDSLMPMKLYSCKIFDGDPQTLVRDYRPAVKNGVLGLQDILPNGEFIAPASDANAFTSGGMFPVDVSQSATKVACRNTVVLTASAPGATSYHWLKNGEPIEGGTNGTLTVNWRSPKDAPTDTYRAVAVYAINGLTAESEPSAEMTIENLPAGMCVIFK